MGRKYSIKAIFNYVVFVAVLFLAYKFFFGETSQKPANPFRGVSKEHPKHIPPRAVNKDEETAKPVGEGEEIVYNDPQVKMDVGDLPKELTQGNETMDNLGQKKKKQLRFPTKAAIKTEGDKPKAEDDKPKSEDDKPKVEGGAKQQKKQYYWNEVDWELEEEMKKRRAEFFKQVKEREEEFEPNDDKNLVEAHDDLTFVTAGSHSTYYATIQFIYSIQYFYPRSKVVIYDIGLKAREKAFIKSLCGALIASLYLNLWPENLYKIRQRIWRPLLLQFAAVTFGHCVYVEPGRYIYRQLLKDYLEQSRVHGIIVGGRQLQHSTFFVTNPHMYTFITTDEKKLKKTPHFEFSLMIIHNTKRVQHFFMRYLMACTMEEYCISPPGAQPICDKNVGGKYGRCHKYDESAINLILNRWHDYSPREYLMKDLITMYYDGTDLTDKVAICNGTNADSNKRDEV